MGKPGSFAEYGVRYCNLTYVVQGSRLTKRFHHSGLQPYATEEQALHAAQRYARAIQEIGIRGCTLGVNIGVATYPLDGSDKETLLRMADERMYAAKERRLSVLQEPGFTLDRPG